MSTFVFDGSGKVVLSQEVFWQANPSFAPPPTVDDDPMISLVGANDLIFVLSGGPINTNPGMSTGGAKSSTVIDNSVGALFGTVSGLDALAGIADYRCFYLVNNSANATLYNVTVWLEQNSYGSLVKLGVPPRASAVLRLTLAGGPTGGTFRLALTTYFQGASVAQTTWPIEWNADGGVTAGAIAEALLAAGAVGVDVATIQTGPLVYEITFSGHDRHRGGISLTVTESNVTGDDIEWAVTIPSAGGPINVPAVTEFGINFISSGSLAAAVEVGELRPFDFVPIWLWRDTAAGTAPFALDAVTFVCAGDLTP